jgi:hypothetical protein
MKALRDEAHASQPKYARILKVGRKVGPVTMLELEIHIGDREPFHVSELQFVPRRVKPEAGQDVAVSEVTSDNHTGYVVLWDQPPHYGREPSWPLPRD